jgi:alpha-galactosidase
MRDALAATKRPIVFSMCSWGHGQPWLWGQQVGRRAALAPPLCSERAAAPAPHPAPGHPAQHTPRPPSCPAPPQVGNSWRTSADVFAVWDAEHAKRLQLPGFLIPVLTAAQSVTELASYAGPGGFNDPDMLVRGVGRRGGELW